MERDYIVVGSITYAYKGRDALQKKGYRAFIEKAPHHISECGCHYLIRPSDCPIDTAIQILSEAKVRVMAVGHD